MEGRYHQSGLNKLNTQKRKQMVISWLLNGLLTWVAEREGIGHKAPITEMKAINFFFLPTEFS